MPYMDYETGHILACPNCNSLDIHPLTQKHFHEVFVNPRYRIEEDPEVYRKTWGEYPKSHHGLFYCNPCRETYYQKMEDIAGAYDSEDDEYEHLSMYHPYFPYGLCNRHIPYEQTPYHPSDCDCRQCDPWNQTEVK